MKVLKETRQIYRRLAREEEKANNLKLPIFSGLNRMYRRHADDTVNNVRNNRRSTNGRRIYYQRIYEVLDTKGKKILSFSTPELLKFQTLPKDVADKVFEIIFDKKKGVLKREIGKVNLVNTIRHITPSENYIKIQKLLIEQTLKRKG